MKQPALWTLICILLAGTACVKRDVVVPLVCEPRDGERGTVVGRVRDGKTGEPLVGAELEVWGTDSRSSTDMGGQYQITNLRPGRYTLTARYTGYVTKQQLVLVEPENTTTADFRTQPTEFALSLTRPTTRSRPVVELGPVIGTHCVSSYPVQWIWDEDLLTQRVDLVGAQAETRLGPVVVGLRAGLLGSYAQSVWADERPSDEYRRRLLGGDIRLSGVERWTLLPYRLSAQAGVALALDYYEVWSWGEKDMNSTVLTQALNTGLRWNAGRGITLGIDVDLNMARQGYTNYFFSDTGPSPFWVYRVGTMSPSVVLSALFPLGSR